jgi:hypothetical protein
MNTRPTFSKRLFWDIDIKELDIDKYPKQVIERVLMYGSWQDWEKVRSYYKKQEIKDIVKGLRSLDKKTVCFLSNIYDIDEKDFVCYKQFQ